MKEGDEGEVANFQPFFATNSSHPLLRPLSSRRSYVIRAKGISIFSSPMAWSTTQTQFRIPALALSHHPRFFFTFFALGDSYRPLVARRQGMPLFFTRAAPITFRGSAAIPYPLPSLLRASIVRRDANSSQFDAPTPKLA